MHRTRDVPGTRVVPRSVPSYSPRARTSQNIVFGEPCTDLRVVERAEQLLDDLRLEIAGR